MAHSVSKRKPWVGENRLELAVLYQVDCDALVYFSIGL